MATPPRTTGASTVGESNSVVEPRVEYSIWRERDDPPDVVMQQARNSVDVVIPERVGEVSTE